MSVTLSGCTITVFSCARHSLQEKTVANVLLQLLILINFTIFVEISSICTRESIGYDS